MAIIAMILGVENRFISGGSMGFGYDCPAEIVLIDLWRPVDFASPATCSVNHTRGNLTARVSGI
jgi:hypothetical protein